MFKGEKSLTVFMTSQVIYFSKTGNTQKIADAIASELNVTATEVHRAKLEKDTLIFLGSGWYGGKLPDSMVKFIQDTDFKSRHVALFGTSGSGKGKEVTAMESSLRSKEAHIKGTFFCRGKFLFFHRGKPTENDLAEARKFARSMTQ